MTLQEDQKYIVKVESPQQTKTDLLKEQQKFNFKLKVQSSETYDQLFDSDMLKKTNNVGANGQNLKLGNSNGKIKIYLSLQKSERSK